MATETSKARAGDLGGTIGALAFIAIGAAVLWDASGYQDADSAVFPRAIAYAMIVFSLVVIGRNLLRTPAREEGEADTGSVARRVGLVAVMLAGAAAMPVLGMLLATLVSFAALMVIAMYEPWTRFRRIVYPIAGAAIVFGFHYLFGAALQVPLPTGMLFE